MACNSINSTIEIFTVALLAILIVPMLLKKKKSRREWLFLTALLLHMVNTLGDLAAWRFAGQPGALALFMTTAGNFLTYFIGTAAYFVFLLLVYLETSGAEKLTKGQKMFAVLICSLSICNIALLLHNYQSGIIFTLTDDNTFTWAPYSGLPDNIILVQLLLLLPMALLQRRYTQGKTVLQFALYAGGPILSVILEHWYPVLMLLYPTVAVSLLLIYVNMQQEQEKQLIQKELELSDSRVKRLLGQIQPHFIFNSLLAIQELCEENPSKAEQAVKDFSRYLRGNLDAMSCDHLIPFEKELEHIRHYLALEMTDPAVELQVVYDLDVIDFMIPSLSVQPIVENAVRHGIGTRSQGGAVTIATREVPEGYIVTVQDDGAGFDSATEHQQQRQSVGLENVRMRLSSQCGGRLEIQSDSAGTVVTITIPKGEHA